FTSASTVRFFLEAVGSPTATGRARVITMGPITSDAARSLGLTVDAEAKASSIAAIVDAVMAVLH
ncbi:MAG TPA: uroporphyrinogen-III synthase, partial [Gemmatimonadaceae bacterium]|nr:uroporphyrinogen-III synthase [Gemmatimonadaceae bacterium]